MIELEKEGGLWTLTINRPEKANSLTREMLVRLAEVAEEAVEAKVLILTGPTIRAVQRATMRIWRFQTALW